MFNIMVVYGTRPEFIKLYPVIDELRGLADLSITVVSSGQHRDMLKTMHLAFDFEPDVDLEIMESVQTPNKVMTRTASKVEQLLNLKKYSIVIVQGDTSTALGGALAAFNFKVPIAHVEAGLRTDSLWSPFPEEGNRRIISQVSSLHFAPTEVAVNNLIRSGADPKTVYNTGNTSIDAIQKIVKNKNNLGKLKIFQDLENRGLNFENEIVLVTAHRRENHGEPMVNIWQAVQELANRFPDVEFVIPVHPSPAVRSVIQPLSTVPSNIFLIEPLGYHELVLVLDKSKLVLTDSGGLQEEAPALSKPVVVLRENTERAEGLEAGTSVLAGTNTKKIVQVTSKLLTDNYLYQKMARATNPFGNGRASQQISQIISSYEALGNSY